MLWCALLHCVSEVTKKRKRSVRSCGAAEGDDSLHHRRVRNCPLERLSRTHAPTKDGEEGLDPQMLCYELVLRLDVLHQSSS